MLASQLQKRWAVFISSAMLAAASTCAGRTLNTAAQLPFRSSMQQHDDLNATYSLVGPPPSPDTFQRVHLSHSGLYLDSPISRGAPPYLSLHLDVPLYSLDDVTIHTGPLRRRTWEDTHLKCGPLDGGGIEACENDDLTEAKSAASASDATQSCRAAQHVREQARILISAESCPPLAHILQRSREKERPSSQAESSYLESITLTFDLQRLVPVRRERRHYWIGRLHRAPENSQDGGALWPLAGSAHAGNDSTSVRYDGLTPNRISSLMQDPYLPRSAKPDSLDVMNGVDLTFASWSYGIAIRAPSNGNHSRPGDPEYEPVHAPVSGQLVWMGKYRIARAPGNHRNDETGVAAMIRDEWGMVYQLLGLYKPAMRVGLGAMVEAGQLIGGVSRTPISWEPPCRHRPADPPEMDDDSRRYPFRSRYLRVMVARPDATWTEWKAPLESGWRYYNPLDAFTLARRTSNMTPDPSPQQMFFAEPTEDGALTPPNIVATSKDLFQPPVLSHKTEVIVTFDMFMDTPGDAEDQMDLMALHALDWTVVPISTSSSSSVAPDADLKTCDSIPTDTVWRTSFEHTKLPNAWTVPLPKTALLAHYVPAFTVGSVPWFKTKFASQFDDKARKLYYAPTRLLVGQTDARGAWNTLNEPQGNGLYQVWVRGRDWFGNVGCFGANVRIRNGA